MFYLSLDFKWEESNDFFVLTKFSTVPVYTISPPFSPPYGPRSIIWSADLIKSMLCSTTIMECPNSIRRLKDFISFFMSWKCNPVVGSSKINKVFSLLFPLSKKEASLILWASPPERVDEDYPSLT